MASIHQVLGKALELFRAGNTQQAEQLCRQILQVDSNQVDALHLLGIIARQTGHLDLAIECFRAAIRLRPDFAEAHNNLGNAFAQQAKWVEAAASYLEALRINPVFAEAHNNLGNALRHERKLEEAIVCFRQAIKLHPNYADAHVNLGSTLLDQRQFEEAAACFRRALVIQPFHAPAHSNLGNALRELGQLQKAEASLCFAVEIQPKNATFRYNLGIVCARQGNLDEAEDCYRQAIKLNPDYAKAHLNLGGLLRDLGQLDEAIASVRTAMKLDPSSALAHSNLIGILHYHAGYDARMILEECQRWNQQHARPFETLIRPHENLADPERRLRIGYVSPDFRNHADSFFTVPLLSNHNHEVFEVICYSDVVAPDALTDRIRRYADVWRDTADLSDEELAEVIRADRIDILIDLKLHTANNRMGVFARKPAPIQVTWLGYPGTTGLSTIDYRLSDPYLDPPGMFDGCYSEETLRLPETFWCYHPFTEEPAVGELPALRNGYITFGCLNNYCKVNIGVLELWARILRVVPGSRLLLLAPRGRTRQHVLSVFGQNDIAGDRIEFVDKQPRLKYLALYQRIDLGLDPFPCPGHTTSLDAAWMGVPTITLVGRQTAVARAGWSQLCNLGLPELAAQTKDEYAELAIGLAGNLERLKELRAGLRHRMRCSPLMDSRRFAQNVETMYREIWRRWCKSKDPVR
jgi:predicted O-linked N-acetylglucosamine transferase (SPINDLY family)